MDCRARATNASVSNDELVTASELREFVFCQRAWWLRRKGYVVSRRAQADQAAGIAFHEQLARSARTASERRCTLARDRSCLAGNGYLVSQAIAGAAPLTGGIILALLVAALFLFLKHRRSHRLGGLPSGELIASDHDREGPLLVSHTYGLTGKPDSLVRTKNGSIIPVERKKGTALQRVRDGDLIQAVAYCILVEDNYSQAPPYVRIQYADRWFDVPYTSDLKLWTLQIADRLQAARRADTCNRSHQIAAKCRNCGQRQNCDQAL